MSKVDELLCAGEPPLANTTCNSQPCSFCEGPGGACSGHGVCIISDCDCDADFTGDYCEVIRSYLIYCFEICSYPVRADQQSLAYVSPCCGRVGASVGEWEFACDSSSCITALSYPARPGSGFPGTSPRHHAMDGLLKDQSFVRSLLSEWNEASHIPAPAIMSWTEALVKDAGFPVQVPLSCASNVLAVTGACCNSGLLNIVGRCCPAGMASSLLTRLILIIPLFCFNLW